MSSSSERGPDQPDFVIAGGMKCGSTTIHQTLANHPNVFLPDGELYVMDRDDQRVHPDFPPPPGIKDGAEFFAFARSNYRRLLKPAPCTGERSTTYLYSRQVPERIQKLMPETKVIVVLRDPVERAHSHYWHNVRTGRATSTLKETIQNSDSPLLRRGYYRSCIQRYQKYIPDNQLKIIFFERLINDTQSVFTELLEFIGLDPDPLAKMSIQRGNIGRVPLSVPLQLNMNQLSKRMVPFRYEGHLPSSRVDYLHQCLFHIDRTIRRLHNHRWKSKPDMPEDVRRFLEDLYRSKNQGLSELVEKNVSSYWSWFSGKTNDNT